MIVPNKVTTYQESIINKMLSIIELKQQGNIYLVDLFNEVYDKFEGIEEFMYSLEVLYILEIINVEEDSGVLSYVKTDKL
ncbi:hypothetical protein LBW89_02620 [Paenibacillus sp. alder61]|uniref:ABC-three component system middle component 7 n=1 Tax=Paenibacillus sp. alder61 TaxID=2862948 RepID=UPI001CD3A091|nr:ABC-three component system middle component 7 [Paenibacillus sp. alder61]MCA1291906.1 hypothetical protein [Paenibacillus sp. alder61]